MAYFRSGRTNLPPVIKVLIIINAIAWLAQITLKDQLNITEWGALHYWRSPLFKPHQLITHMFLHDPDNFMHILFNMLVLWMFGSILENFWGAKRFLNFYLICGIGAALATRFHQAAQAADVAVTMLHYAQLNPRSMPFWSQQGYRPLWTLWEAHPAASLR